MNREKDIKAGRLTPDMSFQERVWAVCSRIPEGQVATYGDLARVLGGKAFRAVGQALNRNPYAPQVPCHRVVGHDGGLTGFGSGLPKKVQLLKAEGVAVANGRVVEMKQRRWRPSAQPAQPLPADGRRAKGDESANLVARADR